MTTMTFLSPDPATEATTDRPSGTPATGSGSGWRAKAIACYEEMQEKARQEQEQALRDAERAMIDSLVREMNGWEIPALAVDVRVKTRGRSGYPIEVATVVDGIEFCYCNFGGSPPSVRVKSCTVRSLEDLGRLLSELSERPTPGATK